MDGWNAYCGSDGYRYGGAEDGKPGPQKKRMMLLVLPKVSVWLFDKSDDCRRGKIRDRPRMTGKDFRLVGESLRGQAWQRTVFPLSSRFPIFEFRDCWLREVAMFSKLAS